MAQRILYPLTNMHTKLMCKEYLTNPKHIWNLHLPPQVTLPLVPNPPIRAHQPAAPNHWSPVNPMTWVDDDDNGKDVSGVEHYPQEGHSKDNNDDNG